MLTANFAENKSINAKIENEKEIKLQTSERIEVITSDYEKLNNRPKINGVEIVKELTFEDLGEGTISNEEIKDIVDKQFKEVFGDG